MRKIVVLAVVVALFAPGVALAQDAAIAAKIAAIEARLAALEGRSSSHGGAQDISAQVTAYYQTVVTAKAMKSLAGMFDEPRGFWQSFGDGGMAGLVFLLLALAAVGTGTVAFGF